MSILDNIRQDVHDIVSDLGGFAVQLTFKTPANVTCTTAGTATKHHTAFDSDGTPANSQVASCTVSERNLKAANYPYLDASGRVVMKGHLVSWTDSHGRNVTYKIDTVKPDELLGLIVCILSNYS